MPSIGTTKMSSKGQVVIPEDIRKQLKLKAGSQFVVVGDKDTVILKTVTQPSLDEFEYLLKYARKQAKKVGMKRSDIKKAVAKVRARTTVSFWRPSRGPTSTISTVTRGHT